MLANNIPTNLPSVERLIQRAMAAERSQQKEVRITIQEIHELTAELALVTSKLGKTIAEIHAMLSEIKNSSPKSVSASGSFDGGSF
jgi:predicted ThiF/HesA family dinucleotide-utilizing enzyme